MNRFTLNLEFREDGGLRVTCLEVPGLLLSHSDPDLVMADVLPALKVMTAPLPIPPTTL